MLIVPRGSKQRMLKGKMNDHEYHSVEADYQGFPLVVVYRKSAKE